MKKIITVFTGYNQRSVLAFIRSLAAHGTPFAIIAIGDDDPIFQTTYKSHIVAVRSKRTLELSDIKNCLLIAKDRFVADECIIAPSTEALNRYVLQHREYLEIFGIKIPLVKKELYEKISDKYSFSQLCKSHGIPVPMEIPSFENAKLPFVAKPKYYVDRNGTALSPVLLYTYNDISDFQKYNDLDSYYYQDFVAGRSIYLLYYIDKNKKIYKYSQENFIQQAGGKSIIAAKSTNLHTTDMSLCFERLLIAVGFTGIIMIEVKTHEDGFYMIEANPRFWGPSQLFVDAGADFFSVMMADVGCGDVIHFFPDIASHYFWCEGMAKSQAEINKLTFHNYTKEKYYEEMQAWKKHDLYDRNDSLHISQAIS